MQYTIIKKCYLIFAALYFLFVVIGKILSIPVYEQLSMLGLGSISYLYIYHNKNQLNTYRLFINSFFFQFICAMFLKIVFILFAESPHGPSADDGILYLEYAQKGAYMSASIFKNYVSDTQWNNIDDYGFLFYLRAICQLFPSFLVPVVLIFLNALYIAIGAVALMKTMLLIDNSNKQNATLAISIFSSFLFFVNSSAVGLKEDLFVPIICFAIYHMVSFYKRKRIINIIYLSFWIALTAFFRLSITLILVVTFIIGFVSSKKNRKTIVFLFILSMLISPFLIDFILKSFLGVSLEFVLKVADARYGQTESDSTLKKIGDIIATFIGPFPNFSSTIDSIFYSYSSLLKMFLNLPVLWVIFIVFKKSLYQYYFIAFYYVVGLIMILVSGTGLDLRYHIPFFVSFIILFFVYLNNFKLKRIAWLSYISLSLLLVYFYNMLK